MDPRVLMSREVRAAAEPSPPFYTGDQKLVIGIVPSFVVSDITPSLEMWLPVKNDWVTLWTASAPIDAGDRTRFTFHDHTFGLTSYDAWNLFVKLYMPKTALRWKMTPDDSEPNVYEVVAWSALSIIQAAA